MKNKKKNKIKEENKTKSTINDLDTIQLREMENFYFPMFNDQSKLSKKKRNNVVTTKKIRI